MGRWVMGQLVTWVAIIRWVTWIMGQWVLTHDPSIFGWAACGDCFCCIMFKSNKTCDLSVMKSCVFSLFTFQTASQFPKRDNHSAEHVWFFCVLFPIFRYHNESLTHFDSIIENALPWVMSHMGHGSSIQWVTWVMGHSKWPIAYPALGCFDKGDIPIHVTFTFRLLYSSGWSSQISRLHVFFRIFSCSLVSSLVSMPS